MKSNISLVKKCALLGLWATCSYVHPVWSQVTTESGITTFHLQPSMESSTERIASPSQLAHGLAVLDITAVPSVEVFTTPTPESWSTVITEPTPTITTYSTPVFAGTPTPIATIGSSPTPERDVMFPIATATPAAWSTEIAEITATVSADLPTQVPDSTPTPSATIEPTSTPAPEFSTFVMPEGATTMARLVANGAVAVTVSIDGTYVDPNSGVTLSAPLGANAALYLPAENGTLTDSGRPIYGTYFAFCDLSDIKEHVLLQVSQFESGNPLPATVSTTNFSPSQGYFANQITSAVQPDASNSEAARAGLLTKTNMLGACVAVKPCRKAALQNICEFDETSCPDAGTSCLLFNKDNCMCEKNYGDFIETDKNGKPLPGAKSQSICHYMHKNDCGKTYCKSNKTGPVHSGQPCKWGPTGCGCVGTKCGNFDAPLCNGECPQGKVCLPGSEKPCECLDSCSGTVTDPKTCDSRSCVEKGNLGAGFECVAVKSGKNLACTCQPIKPVKPKK